MFMESNTDDEQNMNLTDPLEVNSHSFRLRSRENITNPFFSHPISALPRSGKLLDPKPDSALLVEIPKAYYFISPITSELFPWFSLDQRILSGKNGPRLSFHELFVQLNDDFDRALLFCLERVPHFELTERIGLATKKILHLSLTNACEKTNFCFSFHSFSEIEKQLYSAESVFRFWSFLPPTQRIGMVITAELMIHHTLTSMLFMSNKCTGIFPLYAFYVTPDCYSMVTGTASLGNVQTFLLANMHKLADSNELDEFLQSLVLQVLFTLVWIFQFFPQFRHNNLSLDNIMIEPIAERDRSLDSFCLPSGAVYYAPTRFRYRVQISGFRFASLTGTVDRLFEERSSCSSLPNRSKDYQHFCTCLVELLKFKNSKFIQKLVYVNRLTNSFSFGSGVSESTFNQMFGSALLSIIEQDINGSAHGCSGSSRRSQKGQGMALSTRQRRLIITRTFALVLSAVHSPFESFKPVLFGSPKAYELLKKSNCHRMMMRARLQNELHTVAHAEQTILTSDSVQMWEQLHNLFDSLYDFCYPHNGDDFREQRAKKEVRLRILAKYDHMAKILESVRTICLPIFNLLLMTESGLFPPHKTNEYILAYTLTVYEFDVLFWLEQMQILKLITSFNVDF